MKIISSLIILSLLSSCSKKDNDNTLKRLVEGVNEAQVNSELVMKTLAQSSNCIEEVSEEMVTSSLNTEKFHLKSVLVDQISEELKKNENKDFWQAISEDSKQKIVFSFSTQASKEVSPLTYRLLPLAFHSYEAQKNKDLTIKVNVKGQPSQLFQFNTKDSKDFVLITDACATEASRITKIPEESQKSLKEIPEETVYCKTQSDTVSLIKLATRTFIISDEQIFLIKDSDLKRKNNFFSQKYLVETEKFQAEIKLSKLFHREYESVKASKSHIQIVTPNFHMDEEALCTNELKSGLFL